MTDAARLEILARCPRSKARLGRVHTPHGSFDTPAFMPVGTRGTVKGVLPQMLAATGAQICLANTYHLLLRPGPELVAKVGGREGVHALMNWPRPILTDSGGYQAYSMADLNAVDDDGVTFKSIIDGASIRLTPERAIEVQNQLGADVIMAFDDCPPSISPELRPGASGEPAGEGSAGDDAATDGGTARPDPRLVRVSRRDKVRASTDHAARLKIANERTIRWLERCKAAHVRSGRAADQALFGIVQGGTDLDARTWSATRVTGIDLPGYAIGGVAVGEQFAEILSVVRHTAPLLPDHRPRYLMGVGYERDLLGAVLCGVDMFDCVLPTRNGRNANAFTPAGQIRLRNAKFAEDTGPIETGCDCVACAGEPGAAGGFSRAYIRHLFMVGEMLGPILVSLHNLRYFQRFMAGVRGAIRGGDWERLAQEFPVAREGLAALG